MKGLLRCRLWFRERFLPRSSPGLEPEAAQARAVFARSLQGIRDSCLVLEQAPRAADKLAGSYMTQVLACEHSAAWWRQNGDVCTQPWFIWSYCLEHGLAADSGEAQPVEAPFCILRPQGVQSSECALLTLSRMPRIPSEGTLRIESLADDGLQAFVRCLGFQQQSGGFVRKIGERAAPLFDRAVETALRILEVGYPVCVQERALEAAIRERRFQPEHQRWVLALPQPEKLRLSYPRDPLLHSYVCRAGGYWTGQRVEISISRADSLRELMHLYDFRCTREAARRLHAWDQAVQSATVYRPRSRKGEAAPTQEDAFRQILQREILIPDDLREPGE